MPLTAEALAAIGRALSNHNRTQRLRPSMNPAVALLADLALAQRADGEPQCECLALFQMCSIYLVHNRFYRLGTDCRWIESFHYEPDC